MLLLFVPNEAPVRVSLTPKQQRLLDCVRANPRMTYPQLSKETKIGERTVYEYMRFLQDEGIVLRDGSSKKGMWIVKSILKDVIE